MRRPLVCLALLSLPLLALPRPASATLCGADVVPAASLLLPYFEVDLDDPSGTTTLFSVSNADSAPVVAQVVLWTDLAVPTYTFPIYLTGYDVQTINLRDVFGAGKVPPTGVGLSNQGPLSDAPTVGHPGCNQLLPFATATPAILAHLRSAHTGDPSPFFSNHCSGLPYGDGIARGFVTVDAVKDCTMRFPTEAAYWQEVGQWNNVLLGDFFLISPKDDSAQGDPMVHLEASPVGITLTRSFWSGALGGTTIDRREALGGRFASRYAVGGGFSGGTELLVWRDPGVPTDPFVCGSLPLWFPLPTADVLAFDETENFSRPFPACEPLCPAPPPPPLLFPAAAQRVGVNGGSGVSLGGAIFLPFDFGWLDIQLGPEVGLPVFPPPPGPQGWIETTMSAAGRFTVGFDAAQLEPGCSLFIQVPPPLDAP